MSEELKGWLIIGGIILTAIVVFFLGAKLMKKLLITPSGAEGEEEEND